MTIVRGRAVAATKDAVDQHERGRTDPAATNRNTGTVDAKNGPQPQSCNVTQLTNTSFLLHVHVVAHYWENNGVGTQTPLSTGNLSGSDVLSNRWTESVDLDENQFTTKTRSGKFIIRTDNVDGFVADNLASRWRLLESQLGSED